MQVGGSGWCWGRNTDGQVGDGTKKDRSTPTRLTGRWSTVGSRGDLMTVGVRTDGSGWTWGYNSNGQVGDGDHQGSADATDSEACPKSTIVLFWVG